MITITIEHWMLILYAITGFVTAFCLCYHDYKRHKEHGILDTGLIIILCTAFWLPALILSIYKYALTGLYDLITEEEK